jgi:hypothetical protein
VVLQAFEIALSIFFEQDKTPPDDKNGFTLEVQISKTH